MTKIFLFVIGVPGVLAALLTLLPRVSVIVSDPVDQDQPFSSSVTITNTGYLPLRSVMPYVGVERIVSTDGAELSSPCSGTYSGLRRGQWQTRDLGIDERFTFALNDVLYTRPARLRLADIAIIVEYEVPLVPVTRKKTFPLTAYEQSNGKFYWYATTPKVHPNCKAGS